MAITEVGFPSAPRKNGKVLIVQGGQWGSEAKGLVVHKLTLEREVDVAIRTGTVNAGHTVYYGGRAYAMQQLPVSWVRPECELVLGPGAYIHPEILRREIEWVSKATGVDFRTMLQRVWIDPRCGLHLPVHTERSTASNRHYNMGATGKGCSEAVVDKIQGRGTDQLPLFSHWVRNQATSNGFWDMVAERIKDTVRMVNWAYDEGKTILVEGTQGTLLDLHLGDYPYTTHKQTQAANWLAEAGLACTVDKEVWGVYRTFPIRVAGNSGPMPEEMSWSALTRYINLHSNKPIVAEEDIRTWDAAVSAAHAHFNLPSHLNCDPSQWFWEQREHYREAASEIHKVALNSLPTDVQQRLARFFELTTVTKKLRRIAQWDWPIFRYSIMLNRPTHIALTFMNYKFPELWGETDGGKVMNGPVADWIRTVGRSANYARVGIVSFGPSLDATHYIG